MEGINFIEDENRNKRFVQIDLTIHGELWEDFYDLIIAEQRKDEETIPFDEAINHLKKKAKQPILTKLSKLPV
jgi:hypothetical protein